MKLIITILCILLFATNSYCEENKEIEAKFGFVGNTGFIANFKGMEESFSLWLEEFGSKNSISLKATFLPTIELLGEDYINNKFDMVSLPISYYFENKEKFAKKSKNYWSISFNDEKLMQYYLISSKSTNAKVFKDIKNKTLSITEYDQVADDWINKNSLIENKMNYKKYVKDIIREEKESTVILNVFFKKSEFAVVTKNAWDTMIALNPSIGKSLEIITKSEEIFLPFIGMFNNKSDEILIDKFFRLSRDIKRTNETDELFTLLRFDTIFEVKKESLDALEIYYNEYFELKKKYE